MTYKQWLKAIDTHLIPALGVGVDDLADQTWLDWYEATLTPIQVAMEIITDPHSYI